MHTYVFQSTIRVRPTDGRPSYLSVGSFRVTAKSTLAAWRKASQYMLSGAPSTFTPFKLEFLHIED